MAVENGCGEDKFRGERAIFTRLLQNLSNQSNSLIMQRPAPASVILGSLYKQRSSAKVETAMRKTIVITCLFLLSLTFLVGTVRAQTRGDYFPETGHTIDPYFSTAFADNGGLEVLGYPITDAFIDPVTGLLIQYFQNARLELYPVRTGGQWHVRLSPLGEIIGGWQQGQAEAILPLGSKPGCHYIEQSRHWVCYAFLEFFEAHGGLDRFGLPISEFKLENGRLVQYFQHFRLEWRPESAAGAQVIFAALGRLHFEQMGYDHALLQPLAANNTISESALQLRLKTSVQPAVAGPGEAVNVYIQVLDQHFNPVRGAAVVLTARYQAGDFIQLMPVTDRAGISRLTITDHGQSPGQVVFLEFWVVYGEIQAATKDSFRVWW